MGEYTAVRTLELPVWDLLDLLHLVEFFGWIWGGGRNGWLKNIWARLLFVLCVLVAVVALCCFALGAAGAGGVCLLVAFVLLLGAIAANAVL